jgi:hypothetical protein
MKKLSERRTAKRVKKTKMITPAQAERVCFKSAAGFDVH